jgi:3-hydroxyisobutyrate dehydrogenase
VRDAEQPVLGFAGIGLMGRPIAARLLAAGYELLVWNRTPGRCEELVELGAEEVDTPRELAEHCDVVLLCLADRAAVDDVVFGDDGLAATLGEDQLVIDLSSIAPAAARGLAQDLEQACGAGWIDAPVSGGPGGAEAGTLVVFAGGHAEDLERVQSVFAAFSARLCHMGGNGAGQLAKLCNQVIVCNTTLAIAETIALAERCGIDAERLPEALEGGLADSRLLQVLGPRMAVREYEPVLARLASMQKDLDNVLAVAREADAITPLSALAAQLVRRQRQAAGAEADCTSVIEQFTGE